MVTNQLINHKWNSPFFISVPSLCLFVHFCLTFHHDLHRQIRQIVVVVVVVVVVVLSPRYYDFPTNFRAPIFLWQWTVWGIWKWIWFSSRCLSLSFSFLFRLGSNPRRLRPIKACRRMDELRSLTVGVLLRRRRRDRLYWRLPDRAVIGSRRRC